MGQFPQLNQEDVDHVDALLRELLERSEASLALLVEKAGYLIQQAGDGVEVDTTTFATLGSNAYNAVQFMASLVGEANFASMYQQGENFSTLMLNVDENSLLVLVFPTHVTVGSMKYFATPAARALNERIQIAAQRDGALGLDLSDMDATDVQALFQRKE
jgi:predicted regulator of Ras-like GTPase activity (Roadblock/LC7/MglB family)